MHAKLFILLYENHLRIAISSGNLIDCDYDEIQNIVFIQDLKYTKISKTSIFLSDLKNFLRGLSFSDNYFLKKIEDYDWSQITAHLVYSVPGYYPINDETSPGIPMLHRKVPNGVGVIEYQVI